MPEGEEQQKFTFNFGVNIEDSAQAQSDAPQEEQQAEQGAEEEEEEYFEDVEEFNGLPAEEVNVTYRQIVAEEEMEPVVITEELTLYKGHVATETAAQLLGDDRANISDLIPGVYEGGFKLWEGALDMCSYIHRTYKLGNMLATTEVCPELQGKRVLELGCGHGLPGITMLMAGADVHFQDYNREVVQELTVNNALANVQRLPPGRPRPSMRFFAGDWAYTGEFLTSKGFGGHYDIIITCESIYNTESQYRLLECIKQVLQPPHGVVYVASKTYYFGVGGGTKSFKQLVKEDGIFEVTSVFKVEDASSGNVREILKLAFPISIVPYFL